MLKMILLKMHCKGKYTVNLKMDKTEESSFIHIHRKITMHKLDAKFKAMLICDMIYNVSLI